VDNKVGQYGTLLIYIYRMCDKVGQFGESVHLQTIGGSICDKVGQWVTMCDNV